MKTKNRNSIILAVIATSVLILTACGGGSNSASISDTDSGISGDVYVSGYSTVEPILSQQPA